MQEDWEDDLRSPPLMKQYMDKVRETRLLAVIKQSASEHIKVYPALQIPSVLLRELEVIVKTSYQTMKEQWLATLPKLVEYMTKEKLFVIGENADNYEKTVAVLQHLHRVRVWYKKTKEEDHKALILQIFPENTPIAETWAKNKDPPRLLAIDSLESPMSYHCFVDTTPLFVCTDPIEATALLFATFYALRITWTPKAKMPLLLLGSIMLGGETVVEGASNNSKFVTFLRSFGIDV